MSKWFKAKDGLQYHQDNPIFIAGLEFAQVEYDKLFHEYKTLKELFLSCKMKSKCKECKKDAEVLHCKKCGYRLTGEEEDTMLDGELPACPHCGNLFGEKL